MAKAKKESDEHSGGVAERSEEDRDRRECFVIMPISDQEGYPSGHFKEVYEDLFCPAIEDAGFEAHLVSRVAQTNLIHLDMLRRIVGAPMCLCDLSALNPNVFFELGIRQAFNKPVALVQDDTTARAFDVAPLRSTGYSSALRHRVLLRQRKEMSEAIRATFEARLQGRDSNSLVDLLAITPAMLAEDTTEPTQRVLEALVREVNALRADVKRTAVLSQPIDIRMPSTLKLIGANFPDLDSEISYPVSVALGQSVLGTYPATGRITIETDSKPLDQESVDS